MIITACIIAAVFSIKAPAALVAEAYNVSACNQTDILSQDADSIGDVHVSDGLIPSDITKEAITPSIQPANKKYAALRQHFTWGIDVGASIYLSGEDMSTFDAETYFGYKGTWIRTAAIGAGIHKAFGNKYTFIPLYAVVRTSFRSKPSLLFFELKAGYSFNTLNDSGSFGGAYGSFGLGINLYSSKSFQSHIVLAYSYFTLKNATDLNIPYHGDNINSAVLRFGINF